MLTTAPGNGASIGGLKVVTKNGWFAARPSGTEDVYKIYAESFLGKEHLQRIQEEARAVVSQTFAENTAAATAEAYAVKLGNQSGAGFVSRLMRRKRLDVPMGLWMSLSIGIWTGLCGGGLCAEPAGRFSSMQRNEAHATAVTGQVTRIRDQQPWALSSGEQVPIQQVISTGGDGYGAFRGGGRQQF